MIRCCGSWTKPRRRKPRRHQRSSRARSERSRSRARSASCTRRSAPATAPCGALQLGPGMRERVVGARLLVAQLCQPRAPAGLRRGRLGARRVRCLTGLICVICRGWGIASPSASPNVANPPAESGMRSSCPARAASATSASVSATASARSTSSRCSATWSSSAASRDRRSRSRPRSCSRRVFVARGCDLGGADAVREVEIGREGLGFAPGELVDGVGRLRRPAPAPELAGTSRITGFAEPPDQRGARRDEVRRGGRVELVEG